MKYEKGLNPFLKTFAFGVFQHMFLMGNDKVGITYSNMSVTGYPKRTRGYYFYNSEEQKVFVSTNAKFLEEDYIKDDEPKSKIELKELKDDIRPSLDDRI